MKNKSNIITFIFVIISLFLTLIAHRLLLNVGKHNPHFVTYHFIKDTVYILFTGIIIRFIIIQNDNKNISILEKLKRTNNEIKDSNERYDIVAKATSDTIWDWKIQEDYFVWNKGIKNIFGYDPEDVEKNSKWWFDRIHPEDSLKMSIKLYSFLAQKTERWQDEYRFKCKDGSYKYVFDRGFLVKDAEGNAVRMIGAMQDVTKQKEEEQRLKLLETVITESNEAVLITDIDTSQNPLPNIIFANDAFCKMSGYSREEIIGKSPIMFRGPKSDNEEADKLINAIKNFENCFVETISYKKNGEDYWVNFSMVPVTNKEGEYSHWISVQRDVTEIKIQEKEKEQLIRELTQNNKDLKQFSYITSHNFRAPLSNLTGLLHLIEDTPIEDEELKEILNGFKKSTYLLNETIDDLVKVVIIKDNPSIQKEEVTIKEVFENVFFQLNNQIQLHEPIIRFEIDEASKLLINKAYLESIILNILSNAIKYRSPERTSKIIIKVVETEEQINLIVTDNGIGIDLDKNRDKIFGLYQRFHDYPDSKGLGLYLVKSQVEAMGGTIEVESAVNKGTQFSIIFKKQ
jgi:PAS domain S-box-containing protein